MGSDSKLVVRLGTNDPDNVLKVLGRHQIQLHVDGEWGWADIDVFDEALAKRLSKKLETYVVVWTIQTQVDLIWLQCFLDGTCVRELMYSSDEGWGINEGLPLYFENTAALNAWMETRNLLASPDGYDVLDAFVGATLESDTPLIPSFEQVPSLSQRLLKRLNLWMARLHA